jgi:isopenicillin N synthase-like dioxygenase
VRLPIIDLGSSGEGGGASLTRIVAEVGAACRDVGFFYVVNHGVDPELIAKAFTQSHDFFALPVADKRKLAMETIGGNRGYSGLLHEALDPARGPDMKEAFNVGFELAADDAELLAGKPFRSLNAWPGVPGFRETLLSYYDACAALGARLHRALASDLALSQIEAPVVPGAFIVNIGDCLMRWTNDVYVSTPHRVVNRSARERYSIAFFYDPNPDAMVETIPSCVEEGEVGRYPPILAADYLTMRLDASKPAQADRAGV